MLCTCGATLGRLHMQMCLVLRPLPYAGGGRDASTILLLFFFLSLFFLVSWCSPILSKSCNLYNGQLAEILTNLHFPLSCTIASSIVITIPISTTARQYWISLSLHGMMVSILIPIPCCILVAACLCFRLCCSFKMMMTTMTMMTSFQSSC